MSYCATTKTHCTTYKEFFPWCMNRNDRLKTTHLLSLFQDGRIYDFILTSLSSSATAQLSLVFRSYEIILPSGVLGGLLHIDSLAKYSPITLTSRICHVGRTSFTLAQEMRNARGDTLAMAQSQVILMSQSGTSRRPIPLSEKFRADHHDATQRPKPSYVQKLQPPPRLATTCHKYSVRVAASDMDRNLHSNNSVYVRHCLDAIATDMSGDRKFAYFTGDIDDYHVSHLSMLYLGESKAGDMLEYTCWEKPGSANTLHFICHKNGTQIFECTLEFEKSVEKLQAKL